MKSKDKISISYEHPRWWEILFSKYKGGRLTIGPGEYYHDIGGYDWEALLEDDLFAVFSTIMEPLADMLSKQGNYVEYSWSTCHVYVKFVTRENAFDFDDEYIKPIFLQHDLMDN